jgi:hypothetical protein
MKLTKALDGVGASDPATPSSWVSVVGEVAGLAVHASDMSVQDGARGFTNSCRGALQDGQLPDRVTAGR